MILEVPSNPNYLVILWFLAGSCPCKKDQKVKAYWNHTQSHLLLEAETFIREMQFVNLLNLLSASNKIFFEEFESESSLLQTVEMLVVCAQMVQVCSVVKHLIKILSACLKC